MFPENSESPIKQTTKAKSNAWPNRARNSPSIGPPLDILDLPGLTGDLGRL